MTRTIDDSAYSILPPSCSHPVPAGDLVSTVLDCQYKIHSIRQFEQSSAGEYVLPGHAYFDIDLFDKEHERQLETNRRLWISDGRFFQGFRLKS